MPVIACYNPAHAQRPNTFYVLCKGLNSGRPMESARPNSFVVACSSPEEKEFYYWLCYGLWQAKYWYPHHHGSVFPFVTIKVFKKELAAQAAKLQGNAAWAAAVAHAVQLDRLQANLRERSKLLQLAKVAQLRQFVSR